MTRFFPGLLIEGFMSKLINKPTQNQKLLSLLQDGEWHSTIEIREKLFIMQSATRIFEIKEQGNGIESKMMPHNQNDLNSPKVAWYRLKKDLKQDRLFEVGNVRAY